MLIRAVKRYYSTAQVSLIQDGRGYLQYCMNHGINTRSTVFRGTFYELYVKQFVESNLYAKGLIKCGGAYDNGVDIMGYWDLLPFYKLSKQIGGSSLGKIHSKSLVNHAKELESSLKKTVSLQNDINLLIQCKNTKKRLGAQVVRELSGIMEYHKFKKNSTFMFIVSPHPLTLQAISQLDKSTFAMISLAISALVNNNIANHYDFDQWQGGVLTSVYINSHARNLLSGLNIEQQLGTFIKDI
ncbi:RRG7 [Candida oxycetoniae]|uniref:Required for respiratory growth protein 7, mitochondrial n=1 Tax=Candida oxycetoniae TaxID=497107 RepID=A0AAI9T1Z8_9ASCO|nr:RRG7 [Candida oxycetoniae]KAI3406962.1 RRG7 [Candida oxycetoniae]